jgi:hypothetical protein
MMVDLRTLPLSHWTHDELDRAIVDIVHGIGRAMLHEILNELHLRSTGEGGGSRVDHALGRLVSGGNLQRLARGVYVIGQQQHLPRPTHRAPICIN